MSTTKAKVTSHGITRLTDKVASSGYTTLPSSTVINTKFIRGSVKNKITSVKASRRIASSNTITVSKRVNVSDVSSNSAYISVVICNSSYIRTNTSNSRDVTRDTSNRSHIARDTSNSSDVRANTCNRRNTRCNTCNRSNVISWTDLTSNRVNVSDVSTSVINVGNIACNSVDVTNAARDSRHIRDVVTDVVNVGDVSCNRINLTNWFIQVVSNRDNASNVRRHSNHIRDVGSNSIDRSNVSCNCRNLSSKRSQTMEVIRMKRSGRFNNTTVPSCQNSRSTVVNGNSVRTRTISNSHSTTRRSTGRANLLDTNQRTSTIIDVRVSSWEAVLIVNRNKTTNIINKVNDTSVNSCSGSNRQVTARPRITAVDCLTSILTEVQVI